jgi:hypothetical protein
METFILHCKKTARHEYFPTWLIAATASGDGAAPHRLLSVRFARPASARDAKSATQRLSLHRADPCYSLGAGSLSPAWCVGSGMMMADE